jgi:hypothetical protein
MTLNLTELQLHQVAVLSTENVFGNGSYRKLTFILFASVVNVYSTIKEQRLNSFSHNLTSWNIRWFSDLALQK